MVILSIMFRWAIVLGVVSIPGLCFSQPHSNRPEEIVALQKNDKRPVVFFVHTDWCGYCQAMKNITFKNKDVENILNQDFYFVDFNAETQEEISFAGQIFRYKPTGVKTGVNELAESLAAIDGKISYPTLVILNQNYEIIFQYAGFLSAENLTKVLKEIKTL